MEVLESLKDIVKEWIDSAPLGSYGYFVQWQICDEVHTRTFTHRPTVVSVK